MEIASQVTDFFPSNVSQTNHTVSKQTTYRLPHSLRKMYGNSYELVQLASSSHKIALEMTTTTQTTDGSTRNVTSYEATGYEAFYLLFLSNTLPKDFAVKHFYDLFKSISEKKEPEAFKFLAEKIFTTEKFILFLDNHFLTHLAIKATKKNALKIGLTSTDVLIYLYDKFPALLNEEKIKGFFEDKQNGIAFLSDFAPEKFIDHVMAHPAHVNLLNIHGFKFIIEQSSKLKDFALKEKSEDFQAQITAYQTLTEGEEKKVNLLHRYQAFLSSNEQHVESIMANFSAGFNQFKCQQQALEIWVNYGDNLKQQLYDLIAQWKVGKTSSALKENFHQLRQQVNQRALRAPFKDTASATWPQFIANEQAKVSGLFSSLMKHIFHEVPFNTNHLPFLKQIPLSPLNYENLKQLLDKFYEIYACFDLRATFYAHLSSILNPTFTYPVSSNLDENLKENRVIEILLSHLNTELQKYIAGDIHSLSEDDDISQKKPNINSFAALYQFYALLNQQRCLYNVLPIKLQSLLTVVQNDTKNIWQKTSALEKYSAIRTAIPQTIINQNLEILTIQHHLSEIIKQVFSSLTTEQKQSNLAIYKLLAELNNKAVTLNPATVNHNLFTELSNLLGLFSDNDLYTNLLKKLYENPFLKKSFGLENISLEQFGSVPVLTVLRNSLSMLEFPLNLSGDVVENYPISIFKDKKLFLKLAQAPAYDYYWQRYQVEQTWNTAPVDLNAADKMLWTLRKVYLKEEGWLGRLIRFFTGHWNRHHINDVQAILNNYSPHSPLIASPETVIRRLETIPSTGLLRALTQFFKQKHVTEEKTNSPTQGDSATTIYAALAQQKRNLQQSPSNNQHEITNNDTVDGDSQKKEDASAPLYNAQSLWGKPEPIATPPAIPTDTSTIFSQSS